MAAISTVDRSMYIGMLRQGKVGDQILNILDVITSGLNDSGNDDTQEVAEDVVSTELQTAWVSKLNTKPLDLIIQGLFSWFFIRGGVRYSFTALVIDFVMFWAEYKQSLRPYV